MRILNIIFAGICFQYVGFADSGILNGWMDNVEVAQKVAEEKGCPLLIAFLGPNWCSFSDSLEKEILSQKALISTLGEKVVFVKVDIPENFDEVHYYGKDLKERFYVNECPCLILANHHAQAIAKLDYLPITCELFARNVEQLLRDYDRVSHLAKREIKQMKVDELKHLYARAGHLADATFKKALMQQGLKVDRGPYFLVEEYGSMLASGTVSGRKLMRIRGRAVARDPKNEQGSLRKLAIIDFETRVGGKTPQQVVEPLLSYLKKFGPEDTENAWKLEMKISQYLFSKNQIEGALKHARLSYDFAPNDAKQEVAQSIEYLRSFAQ